MIEDNASLKEIITRISKDKNVQAIYLFGSQVNGKARKDSDIDLAVMLKKKNSLSESKIIGYGSDKIDISLFDKLPLIIQFRVFKEGKIILCRDKKFIYDLKIDIFRKYLDYSSFMNRFYRRILNV